MLCASDCKGQGQGPRWTKLPRFHGLVSTVTPLDAVRYVCVCLCAGDTRIQDQGPASADCGGV